MPGNDAWKGNAIAVPGPMAAVPMESWMRTRASAKPTVLVSDDGVSLPSRENVSRVDVEVCALSIEQTNHGAPTLTGGLPVTSGKDELMNLSVKVLTTNTTTSSSLALEREQLEKRRKQLDTANAVAAMNTRLSQLGLLKSVTKATSTQVKFKFPSPVKQQQDSETSEASKSPECQAGNSAISDRDGSSSKSSQMEKLTSSNSDAESLPAQEALHAILDTNTDRSPEAVKFIVSSGDTDESTPAQANKSDPSSEDAGKLTDDLVSKALRKLNDEEHSPPFPVGVGVADSLSVHINGYGSHGKNSDDKCDEGKTQLNAVPQVEVDVSLSSFTSGFVAPSGSSHEVATEKVALSEPVASSLSVFTAGYQAETEISHSDALSVVKPNDSVAIVEDPRQIPVDVSLSTFTSGYDTVKENVTKRISDTKEGVRPPTVASDDTQESAAAEILANLCQPLDDAANSLGKMTSGQEHITSTPNLLEIQNLIKTLRSAITATLKN
ncbi:hypothetical protein L915_15223 [Phytophthora nicotianae]|uniref:Uncharacterized protein n=1 Tax=Phytophthora nicotianae TaxID=4792 RepID=W2G7E6_PHYNI|nr:hypothetical protein L915_15223 [Phytophthora nicotianae]